MVGAALSFAVLDLTGSVSDLGYVFTARSLPLVAFLLVGGVFADRLSRRTVMIGADLVRLGSQGLTATLLIAGHAQVWELAALQAVVGLASAFFYPAVTGLTPMLVGPEHLQQANVLRGISQAAGGIAGPAIAAALVATVGSGWALAVDAASFGVSAAALAALRLPPHAHLAAQRFFGDLRDGWSEFRSHTWLWAGVIAAGLGNMLWAPFSVLGPAIAKSSLGGPSAWALITGCSGAGAFIGGLVALRLRPRRPFRTAFVAYLPFGSPLALLAVRAPAPVVAVAALAGGGTDDRQRALGDHAAAQDRAGDAFASHELRLVRLARGPAARPGARRPGGDRSGHRGDALGGGGADPGVEPGRAVAPQRAGRRVTLCGRRPRAVHSPWPGLRVMVYVSLSGFLPVATTRPLPGLRSTMRDEPTL